MSEQHDPLPEYDAERDTWASWWKAHDVIRDWYAAGITGMDVPSAPWTDEDTAYWTGTARYQPWKDVAALFKQNETTLAARGEW